MNNAIVISQPMFLPWIGMYEQLNLCDYFVHYDDVQFPQGRSFINRVQLKTKDGIKWLTIPIDRKNSGCLINETLISYNENWQEKHISTIKQAFSKAKYQAEVIELINQIYFKKFMTISELNIFAFELISSYFGFSKKFVLSSKLNVDAKSSKKLLTITKILNGKRYITGLGALNYIDYKIFEDENISLEYMNYGLNEYSQMYGSFTPYVTVLDLIANEGKAGAKFINSKSIYWKEFINEE
jgi:hypothetical protein